jgi:hypothetical protein
MKKRFGIKSAILVTLLVVAGVVVALELTNTTHWFHSAADNSGINYGPPTKAEINDSESRKSNSPIQSDATSSDSTPSSQTTKKRVTPEITNFAQKSSTFNVNGFVSGVVESSGTCTLTLTSKTDPSNKVSQSRSSEANATNTTCGVISVPLSKLSAGTWNAVLSYSSSTSAGASDVMPLEVQ